MLAVLAQMVVTDIHLPPELRVLLEALGSLVVLHMSVALSDI